MKAKRLVSLILSAALLAGGVHAAVTDQFPTVNTYPGYSDVAEGDWFYDNARLCYETGLMTGTDVGFEPGKVLTEAEAVALAARVGAALRGDTIPAPYPGDAWWEPYNSYVFSQGGIESPDLPAGRWQFLFMLYEYTETLLTPINDVRELPDPDFRDDVMVLKYYNAGILTGVDKYGSFAGNKPLTRAEAAAMLSRIVRPELRLTFTPADYAPIAAAGVDAATPFFADGVTAADFLPTLLSVIGELEDACAGAGVEFNWFNTYGDQTFLDYAAQTTLALLGESKDGGLPIYQQFDVQVYYSKYLSLTEKV